MTMLATVEPDRSTDLPEGTLLYLRNCGAMVSVVIWESDQDPEGETVYRLLESRSMVLSHAPYTLDELRAMKAERLGTGELV